jgi:hypothetical protein
LHWGTLFWNERKLAGKGWAGLIATFADGVIFYNERSLSGWLSTSGSLVALICGVISIIQFTFRQMIAFVPILIVESLA